MNDVRICSVDGCAQPGKTRGMCTAHYKRYLKHGDALGGRTSPKVAEQYIETVALQYAGEDCLVWPFARSSSGYGHLRRNGKHVGAHRLICELANGAPPTPKHHAAHTCGNGNLGCVNPRHLTWKTSKENNADMLVHGTRARGPRNPRAYLTEEQVMAIRSLRGVERGVDLARKFGTTPQNVCRIQLRTSWEWLS